MKLSLSKETVLNISNKLMAELNQPVTPAPGRQPVHTVYGGAYLFKSETVLKLGQLARRSLESNAGEAAALAAILDLQPKIAQPVFGKIIEKLKSEPVEDYRIDFEDGYGFRADDEEDGHAISAAGEFSKGIANKTLPPFVGIRIKSFSAEAHARAMRTLDLFLTAVIETSQPLPEDFVVTLPKVVSPLQVTALANVLDELESRLALEPASLKLEIMVETRESIIARDGRIALPSLVEAARGRCVAAHFGAYDYTAALGVTSTNQDMLHPACDFARNVIQVSLADTGVWLVDGATNVLPIAPNRGDDLTHEQREENQRGVRRAWRLHYDHCRRALANGFYQSWDLHPAQLVSRYAAVYAFFLEGLDAAADRLRNFMDKAAQATRVGEVFDDAATGQGLLNFFIRAINCGAVTEHETLERTGVTLSELRTGSFALILAQRRESGPPA